MNIRRAVIDDAEDISQLRTDTIKNFNSEDNSKEEMIFLMQRNAPIIIEEKIKERDVFCAIEDNKIKGVIELKNNELTALYVNKDNIRKGIGTALLNFIETYAKSKGIKNIVLYTKKFAYEFYIKKGYKMICLEKKTEAGIIMKLYKMEKKII